MSVVEPCELAGRWAAGQCLPDDARSLYNFFHGPRALHAKLPPTAASDPASLVRVCCILQFRIASPALARIRPLLRILQRRSIDSPRATSTYRPASPSFPESSPHALRPPRTIIKTLDALERRKTRWPPNNSSRRFLCRPLPQVFPSNCPQTRPSGTGYPHGFRSTRLSSTPSPELPSPWPPVGLSTTQLTRSVLTWAEDA